MNAKTKARIVFLSSAAIAAVGGYLYLSQSNEDRSRATARTIGGFSMLFSALTMAICGLMCIKADEERHPPQPEVNEASISMSRASVASITERGGR